HVDRARSGRGRGRVGARRPARHACRARRVAPGTRAAAPPRHAGRARLRAWLLTRATWSRLPAAERRVHLRARTIAFGDETMVGLVLSALERLPAFVAETVVDEVEFFLVGRHLRGWTGVAPTAARAVIVIAWSPIAVETAIHEMAHVWASPWPATSVPMGYIGACARARAAARADGSLAHIEALTAQEERAALALERLWR